MSTRALVWLGSLALLMQAWSVRPLLDAVRSAPSPAAASSVPVVSQRTLSSPSKETRGTLLVAELRIGDWSLSLRRAPPADTPKPVPQARVT